MFYGLEKLIEHEKNGFCELNVIKKCTIMKYSYDDFLGKIKPYTWLYSMDITMGYIFCGDKIFTVSLNGSGLLQINAKCSAKIDKYTIWITK